MITHDDRRDEMAAGTTTTTTGAIARTRTIEVGLPLYYGLHLNLVEDRDGAREAGSPARGALVFFDGVIRRYTCDPRTGQAVKIEDIGADALQLTIAGQGWTTGAQEHGTVKFDVRAGVTRKIVHIAAGVRPLRPLVDDRVETYTVPLPDLLWFASWTDTGCWDRLYAILPTTGPAAGRAMRPDDHLYVPPLFNIGLRSGVVCWGNVRTPPARKPLLYASPKNVSACELCDLFCASDFKPQYRRDRSRKHPEALETVWRALDRRRCARYPLGDLVPALTYGEALTMEPRGNLGIRGDWE